MKKNFKSAFTLIEMAIVVIIIGVIIAGVLGGQELLEVNKRNSLISDLKKYHDATVQFKEKYKFYPGDLPFAETAFITGNGDFLRNGDGDGIIEICGDNDTSDCPKYSEELRAWSHLGEEGLIKESYPGGRYNFGSEPNYLPPGRYMPKSAYKNTIFRFADPNVSFLRNAYIDLGLTDIVMMPVALTVAKIDSVTDVIESFEGFTTSENIYNIDLKMDDGKPKKGDIINLSNVPVGNECSIITVNDPPYNVDGIYNFETSAENCTLLYLINND